MGIIEELKERIQDLEKKLAELRSEQKKMQKDMRFYEWMLMEEYRILLKFLGEETESYRIHSR